MSEEVEVRRSFRLREKPVPNYSHEKFLKAAIFTAMSRPVVFASAEKSPEATPSPEVEKRPPSQRVITAKLTAERNKKYDDIFSSVVANAFMLDVQKTPDQFYLKAAKRKREAEVRAILRNDTEKYVAPKKSMEKKKVKEESKPEDVPVPPKKKKVAEKKAKTTKKPAQPTADEDSSDEIMILEITRCGCGQVFEKHSDCHQHIYNEHDDSEGIHCECSKKHSDVRDAHVCHICGTFAEFLDEHIASHYRTSSAKSAVMECRYCVKQFMTVREVVLHEREKHVGKTKTLPVQARCHICSQNFINYDALTNHYSVHIDFTTLFQRVEELQYKVQAAKEECPVCRVSISTRKTFRTHMLRQHYDACWSILTYGVPDPPQMSDIEVKQEVNAIVEMAAAQTSSTAPIPAVQVKKEVKEEMQDDSYPAC